MLPLLPECAGRLIINYTELKIHLKGPSHTSRCYSGGKRDKNLLEEFFFPVISRIFNIRVLILLLFCLLDLILIKQTEGMVYAEHETVTH